MLAWFWFWMIAIGLSAILFFGVAILVAIFGWRDLRDLYQELQVNCSANNSVNNNKINL